MSGQQYLTVIVWLIGVFGGLSAVAVTLKISRPPRIFIKGKKRTNLSTKRKKNPSHLFMTLDSKFHERIEA